MKRVKVFLLFLLLIFTTNCAQAQSYENSKNENQIALRASRLLDVSEGKYIENPVILIKGEKIVAVGNSNLNIPAGTQILALGNVTLLPGLIDAHTHITYHFDENGKFGVSNEFIPAKELRYSSENALATLNDGITTIRNLGAGGLIDVSLRDAINEGKLVGPRMVVSGAPLTPDYLFQFRKSVDRINFIRQFVKQRVAEGVDVIKVFEGVDESGKPLLSSEEIKAAVEEAAKHNLKVAVHAHEAAAIKAAVKGGCASIEHGTFLDDEAIKLMLEHHTALVPTLYLPTHYLEHKKQFVGFDASTWDFFENLKSVNLENFRRARKAGVWIVAGSDAVAGLHGHNSRELIWMVKGGMKPAEAIHAATIDGAKLLGLEDKIGEIRAGKYADIIAVAGDPLTDISDIEKVVFVMKAGKVFRYAGKQ